MINGHISASEHHSKYLLMGRVMNKVILILPFILFLQACAAKIYTPPKVSINDTETAVIKKLYRHYNEWRGVKYKQGGMTKKGIDCSAYVHLTYKHKFNKKIPRSTELLARSGKPVQLQVAEPGDVVFFKTGWKSRHVGIYLGKKKFMHASSSRGVMISRLNNPYWSDAYWMARRY